MANRLTKIVTKTGDTGTTALADGKRISKADSIIFAIGAIDELNSAIGMVRVVCKNSELTEQLTQIQHQLFNLGGDLCLRGSLLINDKVIKQLESNLEQHNQQLKPLLDFILPTGSELTARLHMARSICRRAECMLVKAREKHEFNPLTLTFINRLSDYLFIMARCSNEHKEEIWC